MTTEKKELFKKKIFIFFYDSSEKSQECLKKINEQTETLYMSCISITDPKRNQEVIQQINESNIIPLLNDDSTMASSFLVQDDGSALYELSFADIVIKMAKKPI